MGAREGKARALNASEHEEFINYLSKTRHADRDRAIYLTTCRAGFDGASSHSGRRHYASSLLKKGVDIVALSKLMGHSNITTTQQYVHHDEDKLKRYVSSA